MFNDKNTLFNFSNNFFENYFFFLFWLLLNRINRILIFEIQTVSVVFKFLVLSIKSSKESFFDYKNSKEVKLVTRLHLGLINLRD